MSNFKISETLTYIASVAIYLLLASYSLFLKESSSNVDIMYGFSFLQLLSSVVSTEVVASFIVRTCKSFDKDPMG